MKLNKNILGSLIWRGAYFATIFLSSFYWSVSALSRA